MNVGEGRTESSGGATIVKNGALLRVLGGIAVLFLAGIGVGAVVGARGSELEDEPVDAAAPAPNPFTTAATPSSVEPIQSVDDISAARRTPT
ncbi:MAG: hypothetical protein MJB57_11235, partial [Gemmatimonadetes bacterium]|nr:hypothetical protein [Gemmatimonadota bacterium]